jgi:histidinol-phosphate aminotransferase
VTRPTNEPADHLVRAAVRGLVPYEPGKPVEEIQRELGLERVVKLASNEGPFGPFPAAIDAIERSTSDLNRYPDGGAYRLRAALAERHSVAFEQIAPGSGADGVVDCLSQVLLDPGDEVVLGWPSFPSYAIDARKMGAEPRLVPLREHRYDPRALLEAVGPRTKIVFLCHPNNPTGTAIARLELDEFFARVPDHVLAVVDQAYFEYVDDPDYLDAVEEYPRGERGACGRFEDRLAGCAWATASGRRAS